MKNFSRLDGDRIAEGLGTARIGKRVVIFNDTASTNDIAFEYARDKNSDGLVVAAENQSKGRGRFGKRWEDDWGLSILMSVVLREETCNEDLLSLTLAIAATEAIGCDAKIKWPNDIFIRGRKVGGILIEGKKIAGQKVTVAGIGINCHQQAEDFSKELREKATSVDIESGRVNDRNLIIRRLLMGMEHWLERAVRDSEMIVEEWRKLSVQLGHRVTAVYDGRRFSGNCIGVDPRLGLVLQLDSGSVRMFDSAHTSIWTE